MGRRRPHRVTEEGTRGGNRPHLHQPPEIGRADGHIVTLDARTGKLLWQTNLGPSVAAGPITYAVNGKQYVSIQAGSSMFTFGLREP